MFVRVRAYLLLAVFFLATIFITACSNTAINEVNPDIIFDQETHEGDLTVHFFHLVAPDRYEKTGESILITTPKGKTILIDAGTVPVGSLVTEYLTKLGIDKLDYVMPSHPHHDHIGGLLTVFEEKEVEQVIEINLPHEDSNVYLDYRSLIEKHNIPVDYAEEGMVYEIEEDLTLEILNPMKGLSPETYSFGTLSAGIINDVSMVVKLTHKDNTFLFTGDIYRGVEHSLIKKFGEKLDVDVVVAPHHGLGTSNSEDFIKATDPSITLIPSNVLFDLTVVDNYKKQGSEVYISKFDGNVLLKSNGKKIDVYREFEAEDMEADDPDAFED